MFSQYFGQYLLNHELITREQLTDALEYQQSVHVKFGVLAVDEGLLTPLQVEAVHEKQKQIDKRFGEIAVELGYLTGDQVESLVSKQKQNHLFLAQALVDREYMTIEQFAAALNDFKKEYSLSDDQFESMKNGNMEAFVENILNGLDSVDKDSYGRYLTLFSKNMIRFIDDQVYIELSENRNDQHGNMLVHQEIVGETPLFTAMSMNKELFLYIASKYAEEELTEIDELSKASVSEFLNLNNGIYLVNMSNWGIELNMKPQEVCENAAVTGKSVQFSVHTSRGAFDMILSSQPSNLLIEYNSDSKQLV
ncbi:hypothetical protein [Neobacillus sp. D3-1R]|uniref:hypothetical protein n=1 Tax=Neobacillus sp. D3-1R TaxID=3445778 RepID=UPI003FA150E6